MAMRPGAAKRLPPIVVPMPPHNTTPKHHRAASAQSLRASRLTESKGRVGRTITSDGMQVASGRKMSKLRGVEASYVTPKRGGDALRKERAIGNKNSGTRSGEDRQQKRRSPSGGGSDPLRSVPRRRPEWDDSLGDPSQYRLTPEEAVQRKKALVSKHNTLVFGFRSKRVLKAGGGTTTGADVAGAAERATAKASEEVPGDERRRRVSGRRRSNISNTNTITNNFHSDSTKSALHHNSKQNSALPHKFDADKTIVEEHVTVGGNGVNDTTATLLRLHSDDEGPDAMSSTPIAKRGEHVGVGGCSGGQSATDDLGLAGIEVGIRAFSERVWHLETDRRARLGYGNTQRGERDEASSTDDLVSCSGDLDADERCRSTDGGATCPPLRTPDAFVTKDIPDQLGRSKRISGRLRGAGSRGNEKCNEVDLLERIHLLEVQVRGLQLTPVALAAASNDEDETETDQTEATTTDGGSEEERARARKRTAAEAVANVRSVIEGLLSLTAHLLQRVTVAEQRLRIKEGNGEKKCDTDHEGKSATDGEDEEVGRLVRGRAKSILQGGHISAATEATSDAEGCATRLFRSNVSNAHDVGVGETLSLSESSSCEALVEEQDCFNTGRAELLSVVSTPTMAPPAESHKKQQKIEQDSGGRETPAPGARSRPSPPLSDTPSAFHHHGERRTSPLQPLRLASTSPAKDCWGEALEAVSTLVANRPVATGLVSTTAPLLPPGATTARSPAPSPLPSTAVAFRPIEVAKLPTVAASQHDGDATMAGSSTLRVPSPQVSSMSSARRQPHIIGGTPARLLESLAPIDTVGGTSRLGGGGGGDSSSNSNNLRGLSDAADVRSSVLTALAAPIPVQKPMHPFERGSPMRSPRWLRQQRGMVNAVMAGEASVVAKPPPLSRDVIGRSGGGNGNVDGVVYTPPAVGEWYTPSSSACG